MVWEDEDDPGGWIALGGVCLQVGAPVTQRPQLGRVCRDIQENPLSFWALNPMQLLSLDLPPIWKGVSFAPSVVRVLDSSLWRLGPGCRDLALPFLNPCSVSDPAVHQQGRVRGYCW